MSIFAYINSILSFYLNGEDVLKYEVAILTIELLFALAKY